MSKKQFQAESKRLLDLMINSIYTNKEIFLRELISNASDAIDKIYYQALTDDSLDFNKSDYFIRIDIDKDGRKLIISDRGIGMTEEELDKNLGVIARSGSYDFKNKNQIKDGHDIIGQFGVGFYSAFMVADSITVVTRALGQDQAYSWQSSGEDGYTIEEAEKEDVGTDIILTIKESTEEEDYDRYLEEYVIMDIVKKYSDYIRYPIKMELSHTRPVEGQEDQYEEYRELETINSMVPLWRQNKNDLEEEDYENFYYEKRFGFDKPLKSIHMTVDGLLRFNSLLYIPSQTPFDFYSKDYEKGLELYSSGVMIMEKCSDLLPDYYSFVRGVVDSEDLSLNISREMLQQDRQLSLIAKNIEKKIGDELRTMMDKEREAYEDFFKNFGMQLKYGIYDKFGRDREKLEDLILFPSSREGRLVSFKEYLENMQEDQAYIYYAAGDSLSRVESMPQTEILRDKGFEILYLVEPIDEFVIKMMQEYEGKEFKSVMDDDLGIDTSREDQAEQEKLEEQEDLFKEMEKILEDRVIRVKPSKRLKDNPVCFATEGEISIEMEKLINAMPQSEKISADKILEINMEHKLFKKLEDSFRENKDRFQLYTELLYDQALLIEGLEIEDPIRFTNNIWKLM